MNRIHPYSAFLLALLTGSFFMVAALLARPVPSAGDEGRKGEASSGRHETLIAAPVESASGMRHLQYGLAAWWPRNRLTKRLGDSRFSGEAALSLLLSPPAMPFHAQNEHPATHRNEPQEEKEAPVALAGEDTLHPRALKFKKSVERYAARFRIKPNLVFAIIKAESNFNALAASTASAYGLMQLVPESGGRAAYRMVTGHDVIPTREYLQDPEHNIELGTAYLRHLAEDYFHAVENADSREYCLIAAYNTGPANVYRAFGGDYAGAMEKINSLSPPEVFDHLTHHLPYAETREYLTKVVSSRHEFVAL